MLALGCLKQLQQLDISANNLSFLPADISADVETRSVKTSFPFIVCNYTEILLLCCFGNFLAVYNKKLQYEYVMLLLLATCVCVVDQEKKENLVLWRN